MYRDTKKTADHPDPQVSRSLFLLSNLASSLYGGTGSKAPSKPALEEYELQEMSEDFATSSTSHLKRDSSSSDYRRMSFGYDNGNDEGDDFAQTADHGDWSVDTEQHLYPQFAFPESSSGIDAVESTSASFIITPNSGRDEAGNIIGTDEKLTLPIDVSSTSNAPISWLHNN